MIIVREKMAFLNIEPIFSPVYSPWFQPIEVVFSKAKHYYKKLKLQSIMQGDDVNINVLIRRAFRMVTKANCRNYIRHCYDYLREKANE